MDNMEHPVLYDEHCEHFVVITLVSKNIAGNKNTWRQDLRTESILSLGKILATRNSISNP